MTKRKLLLTSLAVLLITLSTASIYIAIILTREYKNTEEIETKESTQPDQIVEEEKEEEIVESKEEESTDPKEEILPDTSLLQTSIDEILAEDTDNYAVYIKGLSSTQKLGINEDTLYFPGSIYKVPIAVLVLSDIEKGKYSLNSKIELKEENKRYTTDLMYSFEVGTSYSVETLLRYMISHSDNTAWDMLQDNIGSTDYIDKRFEEELDLEHTRRIPFQTTAREVAQIFEKIYTHEYLTSDNSDYLLDLLSNVIQSHNNRIPAGLPTGTHVAHKISNWYDSWQDAGIVFGENGDYIIVVLNRNISFTNATQKIPEISRVTWEYFQNITSSKIDVLNSDTRKAYIPKQSPLPSIVKTLSKHQYNKPSTNNLLLFLYVL